MRSLPVEESWLRIVGRLARDAPVTAAAIRPPAPPAEVEHTASAVGRPLPTDLLAWWALMDGIADADYRAPASRHSRSAPRPCRSAGT